MVLREVAEAQAGLPVPNSTHSYWHIEPSEKLIGHKSTPELPKTADVVVVGSGMTGAFAAHFLKENGKHKESSLLMLEAREACWGATGRNGGHCQPFLYTAAPEVASFELETYFFLQQFVKEHNIDCSWRSLPGVHAVLNQDIFHLAEKGIARLKSKIPEFADKIAVVSPSGSSESQGWAKDLTLENLRVPNIKGAIVQRYAASMWPYKLVCWVLENLLQNHPADKFNLQTNTPVTSVSKEEGTGAWVVQTPRGKITAKNVLLATNGYTSRLLPEFTDLVVPVRGQIGALFPPEPRVTLDYSYVFFGQFHDDEGKPVTRDEYLVQRPLPGGELIYGGGRQVARGGDVGEWRDDTIVEPVAAYLRTELESVLNLRDTQHEKDEKMGLEARMEWTGIMGYSRDQSPFVGPVPESLGGGSGLFICSGYTGHGMPRAALCARGIVRMMNGNEEHGVPADFVLGEDRALKARTGWGVVGTEDEMEAMSAEFRALLG